MSENATTPDPDSTFLVATSNPGKRREFERLLGDFIEPDWDVFDRPGFPRSLDEIEETAETFEGNAVKKAVESAAQTGCTALADDSGLEVDALDGAPGVHSSRFAGPDATDEQNNRLLISKLEGVDDQDRTARFVAVLALALPDNRVADELLARAGIERKVVEQNIPDEEATPGAVDDRVVVWFRGTLEGRITEEPGGEGGFGYDPYFWVPEYGCRAAQLSVEQKNRISHRSRAVDKLLGFFENG